MQQVICFFSFIVKKKTRRNHPITSGSALFSDRIGKRIFYNLGSMLHFDVVAHTRGRTSHLPCYSGVTVILVVQLMHPNQLLGRHSLSHGFYLPALAGLAAVFS